MDININVSHDLRSRDFYNASPYITEKFYSRNEEKTP